MSSVKEAAVRLIQSLPETCTFEDIQYRLYVREKVERSIQAIDVGEVVSEEEADQRIAAWLYTSGRKRTCETCTIPEGTIAALWRSSTAIVT